LAAVAAVASLSGAALVLGGTASADPGSGRSTTGSSTVQVQDTTPAPDEQRDRDCLFEDRQGGSGGSDGASDAPSTAPVTTEL